MVQSDSPGWSASLALTVPGPKASLEELGKGEENEGGGRGDGGWDTRKTE